VAKKSSHHVVLHTRVQINVKINVTSNALFLTELSGSINKDEHSQETRAHER